jgi:Fe-S cluster assembly ATP-binding protein
MLKIENLDAKIENLKILKKFSLNIEKGTCHVIMGPNGTGKSSLSKIIAGHSDYIVESGKILFDGEDILNFSIDKRAKKGIFIGFQYPIEIAGISNYDFLYQACMQKHKFLSKEKNLKEKHSKEDFEKKLLENAELLNIDIEMLKNRDINEGFSGGEKKKNEILQMMMLDPKFIILDEIDSGVDIDALKIITKAINFMKKQGKTIVLITHYSNILKYIDPDNIHILLDGKIVKTTNDKNFVFDLEEKGYEQFKTKN